MVEQQGNGNARGERGDAVEGPRGVWEARRGGVPEDVARAWDDLVGTARRTVADGLVVGTSGNVSVRVGDTVLVTPTGVPYDRLTSDDVTGVDLSGRQVLGTLRPTSELPMHLAIHNTTDARAVVHTHAVHATAVSTLVSELPLIHYMSAALGGPVRVAPYATYGTPELAENMLRALTGRTGCLLQNHGTITYGHTLSEAYDRTAQLEWMSRVWLTASSVPGRTPHLLTPAQLATAATHLHDYGQPR
ncbi:class II aldolase/adducin family protein [Streptomyces sp. 11x1]|uniref:class II aldolase/adducin family protein n=1 Tax=Streptomyces sp. 11x1 TaxID=3038642 RepID=UPI00292D5CB0|nr:class II aldolase/adducin family protein [Streptomyces sp. 11x1]WNZ12600.1 class II aldolase/adducin family protein [Streptomyces sp. 11x1]